MINNKTTNANGTEIRVYGDIVNEEIQKRILKCQTTKLMISFPL